MKKIISFLLIYFLICSCSLAIEINCPNAILIENKTGKILYEKDAYSQQFPASTTKIMTAILTLENLQLNENVTASSGAISSVPSGGSNVAIQPGESFPVSTLLRGLLISSGNETANILAEKVSGSVEEFAILMNKRAKEIGCKGTNFVNSNGLHDENHYSTAYDLVTMYRFAYNSFAEFRKIVSELNFTIPNTGIYSKSDRTFTNTNKLINPQSKYYYKYCTGGKTGYTSQAKNCLVSSASKDGIDLFVCVLGGQQDESLNSQKFEDTIALFDYGFSQIAMREIVKENELIDSWVIENAPEEANVLNILALSSITAPVLSEESETKFAPELIISGDLLAPIFSGDKLGIARYTVSGLTYETDIIAQNSIEEKIIFDWLGILKIVCFIFIFLVVLIIIIRIYNISSRENQKKSRLSNVRRYNARFHR